MTQEIIDMVVGATTLPEPKVKKMVDGFIQKLKDRDKNISDEDANTVAMAAFKARYMPLKKPGTAITGLCIGFGRIRDENKSLFDKALNFYESDPEGAIADGVVTLDPAGNPVVLDYREFIDKDGKYANNKLGQPLEHINYRQAQFIVDGKIMSANIRDYVASPMLFCGYDMVGWVGKFIKPTSAERTVMLSPGETWDALNEIASKVDEAITLDEVYDVADYDIVIVKGFVRDSYDIVKFGSRCIQLDDVGVVDPIPCYDANEEVFDVMGSIIPGNEVIVIGQVRNNKDDVKINVLGIALSPQNSIVQELMEDLE